HANSRAPQRRKDRLDRTPPAHQQRALSDPGHLERRLGAKVSARVPDRPGSADGLLIKADKNPNTLGATLLGLAGPAALDAAEIVDGALAGNLDVLWVRAHDLVTLFGEEKIRELSKKLGLFVF